MTGSGGALVLTCGDPAGIGPELAVKAWKSLGATLPFAWIGDPRHLPSETPIVEISTPAEAHGHAAHAFPVLPLRFPETVTPGTPTAANAASVIEAIRLGAHLAASGQAKALCTAPISKKALIDGAGFAFPGHTEFLAHLADVPRVVMMLASPLLRTVPATIHIALADVPKTLTKTLLAETIRITHQGLVHDFGLVSPRIAVAGLNPHAGEGGAMGREEIELIIPTLEALRSEGMTILGPLPADTMFHKNARAQYDAAIAMYHDQALVPIKTLDFEGGVNVTLGLPFIRTSPDHGTAFDIAGKDQANPTSLIAALKLADDMANTRAVA